MAGSKEWNWLRMVNDSNENILVLIQLNGGNDGLNTFVPINQYSNLYKVRKNVLLPESDLLSIDKVDDMKFHPGLAEIRTMWNEEKMGIIQNVGYPNPNKSHFRSTDIWTSASDADVLDNTGWLGRYLSDIHPEYPTGYPNQENDAPLAITVDSMVSNTCQSASLNMSFAVNNLNNNSSIEGGGQFYIPDNAFGDELQFIIQSIEQSNAYGSVINHAATKGTNLSSKYSNTRLSNQLKIVAKLISGGLGTKIYVVKLGGFDTHASQVDNNSKLTGRHADLMRDLSTSIHAFFDDLTLQGKSEKVVAMTFSEFGRRTNSNGSLGTDHGEAAPVMLFGEQVMPIIHGTNPEIPDKIDGNHNLPMQTDFRSVYASLLIDLFGVSDAVAREVVHPDIEYFPVLGDAVLGSENIMQMALRQNYPNPVDRFTAISFKTRGLPVEVEILDMQGRHVKTVVNKTIQSGIHEITIDLSDLKSGTYIYRLKEGMFTISKKLIKY